MLTMDGRRESFWDVSEEICTPNPHGRTWELCLLWLNGSQWVVPGAPFCPSTASLSQGSVLLSSLFLLPTYSPFLALIIFSLLSSGCCKFISVTHRNNVPLNALRKRLKPSAPRQKSCWIWLHGLTGHCDQPTVWWPSTWLAGEGAASNLTQAWEGTQDVQAVLGCPGCAGWLL